MANAKQTAIETIVAHYPNLTLEQLAKLETASLYKLQQTLQCDTSGGTSNDMIAGTNCKAITTRQFKHEHNKHIAVVNATTWQAIAELETDSRELMADLEHAELVFDDVDLGNANDMSDDELTREGWMQAGLSGVAYID